MPKSQRIALITVLIYSALMGSGMYVLRNYVGSSYLSADMPRTIVWFEVAMTAVATFVYLNYFKQALLRFKADKPSNLFVIGFALMFVNLIAGLFIFLFTADFSSKDMSLIAIILAAAILVGTSEELVFRGIVLPAFLANGSRVKAVLVSSVLFSGFHATNLLGGLSFGSLLVQLANTFFLGVTFACIAVETGRLLPLMIFHALYDFVLLVSNYTEVNPVNVVLGSGFGIAFGLVMLGMLFAREKRGQKQASEAYT